jgi:hypothetical protein
MFSAENWNPSLSPLPSLWLTKEKNRREKESFSRKRLSLSLSLSVCVAKKVEEHKRTKKKTGRIL